MSGAAGAQLAIGATADDAVYPFILESLGVRGRLVRLGPALDAILARHDYPAPVTSLLGETVALAAVLASSIKYDGVFTLQAQGDGPVRLVVVDVTAEGHLRGYAAVNRDRLAALPPERPANPVPRLLGAGYLAFTVDQGVRTERYQAIVDLAGPTVTACAQHYFRQSEQIETVIHLGLGQGDGRRRAGGLMIQRLPGPGEDQDEREDGWRHLAALVGSVTDEELANPAIGVETLLYRLFHEFGVRLFRRRPLADRCRCSRERAANTLRMLEREELSDLKIDGAVVVTCEFCNRSERFDDDDLDAIFAG